MNDDEAMYLSDCACKDYLDTRRLYTERLLEKKRAIETFRKLLASMNVDHAILEKIDGTLSVGAKT